MLAIQVHIQILWNVLSLRLFLSTFVFNHADFKDFTKVILSLVRNLNQLVQNCIFSLKKYVIQEKINKGNADKTQQILYSNIVYLIKIYKEDQLQTNTRQAT